MKGTGQDARKLGLYMETPLIHSFPLSTRLGRPVYLKLDCLQASGSFKDRGMANLCLTLQRDRQTTKLIGSSGGNAGLALVTVANRLGLNVAVVVPQSTKPNVIAKLRAMNAEVTVHGRIWNEADEMARSMAAKDPEAEYVSPYDHPLLWMGHSTVVDELVEQLKDEPLSTLIVSVGGGGLICGALEGLERNGLTQTQVIAAETEGAASCAKALEAGEPVRLEGIDSIATSLGALQVTEAVLERAQKHQGGVISSVCTDAEAVDACVQFANDHRMLVEPACGAALAVVYSDRLREALLAERKGAVVVEVCGGSGVSLELLNTWSNTFA